MHINADIYGHAQGIRYKNGYTHMYKYILAYT